MVTMVRALTGCQNVVDSSGGAEAYGGDLREYGAFDVFHPYCDLPFYPPVLDSLRDDQRWPLLGETIDHDVHRDLARLGDELPFWASALPELNAPGVRRQVDLPRVLDSSRFALEPTQSRHKALMESSRRKALFVRKTAIEAVRARTDFDGYVITGWRDTPISSSGFFDDWGSPRFTPEECRPWNGGGVLFPIPSRCPAWIHGGNRPGWLDPLAHFAGDVFLRLGGDGDAAGDEFDAASLAWKIVDIEGMTIARGTGPSDNGRHKEWAQVVVEDAAPGEYRLEARCGPVENAWRLWVRSEAGLARLRRLGRSRPGGADPRACDASGRRTDGRGEKA